MKNRLLLVTGTVLVLAVSSAAQENLRTARLQVNWLNGQGQGGVRSLDESFDSRVVKGKPFSATEELRSIQVLGNGTRIENSESNRLYRDSEGRTRVEDMSGKIAIWDPVAGFRVELDPKTKVARRSAGLPVYYTEVLTRLGTAVQESKPAGGGEVTENLKPQMVNGVTAQGTKVTNTIPRGQIGNDREIVVVTERWVSNDLQMLVKSVNTDPRFGDTTYEVTRIIQGPQDGSLFQVPSDYTQPEAGRGARGGGGRGTGPGVAPPPPPLPGAGSRGGARSGGPAK